VPSYDQPENYKIYPQNLQKSQQAKELKYNQKKKKKAIMIN